MKRTVILISLLFAIAAVANGQSIPVGSTVENFLLPDATGTVKTFNDLKGKNGAVVVFVSSQCPVVKGYNERMNQIVADYEKKGITFIGINSNVGEIQKDAAKPVDWVKTHIDATYKFPVLFDKGNVFADKLGATVTPEAYFVDGKNVLQYHGAIDNDRSGNNITDPYLRTAFDASLAGKKIGRTSANAFGCSIKRVGE